MKFVRNNAVILGCMAAFLFVLLIIGLRIAAVDDSPSDKAGQATGSNSPDMVSNLYSDSDRDIAPAIEQTGGRVAPVTPSDNRVPLPKSTKVAEAKNSLVREDLASLVSKGGLVGGQLEIIATLVKDLCSNEAGRQLGQANALLESYMSYEERFKAASKQYDSRRRELILFQAEVEEQLELYPTIAIADPAVSQLKTLGDAFDQIELELEQCKLGLAALVSEAEKYTAGEKSLAAQVENYLVDKQSRQIQAIAEERKLLEDEAIEAQKRDEQKLAEAKEKLRQEKVAAELVELEAAKGAARIAAEEKEKKLLLEAEFERDLPKIQRYLGPLFVKTTKQPGGNTLIETKESMPVSLAALNAVGLSNPDVSKACSSLLLFFTYFKTGERGQGPYPYYFGGTPTTEHLAAIRPAYDLLDKYADLLVEKGLLAK